MLGADGVAFSEVRDRARDAQDAVMGAGGQTESLEGAAENGRRLVGQRTELREKRGRNGGVAETSSPCRSYCRCRAASTRARMVSELSSCARLRAASASYSTGCTVIWRSMRSSSGPDRRRRYCCTRSLRAGAAVCAVPAARTGVHGGDELKIGRISDLSGRPGDGQLSVLHRLPQHLERVAPELGQLVEEQHAAVRERDLAGQGKPSG